MICKLTILLVKYFEVCREALLFYSLCFVHFLGANQSLIWFLIPFRDVLRGTQFD